jgi:hypothetical protein
VAGFSAMVLVKDSPIWPWAFFVGVVPMTLSSSMPCA